MGEYAGRLPLVPHRPVPARDRRGGASTAGSSTIGRPRASSSSSGRTASATTCPPSASTCGSTAARTSRAGSAWRRMARAIAGTSVRPRPVPRAPGPRHERDPPLAARARHRDEHRRRRCRRPRRPGPRPGDVRGSLPPLAGAPAGGCAARRPARAPSRRPRGDRGRHRTRGVHGPAGRPRDGEDPGPRAGRARRRRSHLRCAPRGRACTATVLWLPSGPRDRVAIDRRPAAGDRPRRRNATLGRHDHPGDRTTSRSTSTVERLRRRSREAVQALGRLPAALLRLGAARIAAGDTDEPERLVPRYASPPRGAPIEQGRTGEWRGRATPGSDPDRADDARRHPGRSRHRAGELRRALAGRRVPQRARHEPARELRRRARGRRGRRLRRPVGHGRRGAHHDVRRRSPLAPPAASDNTCCFGCSSCPTIGAPARRRSRSGCRTCRPAGCTRSTASDRSASGRATTRTTARTR